jgi:hypothetical protein
MLEALKKAKLISNDDYEEEIRRRNETEKRKHRKKKIKRQAKNSFPAPSKNTHRLLALAIVLGEKE